MSDDIAEGVRARRAAEDELRERLAQVDLDGPHRFSEGGVFGAVFGGTRDRFAICTICGAMVILNDPGENAEGGTYERSATLHARWHASNA